jgi:hypothetical protein
MPSTRMARTALPRFVLLATTCAAIVACGGGGDPSSADATALADDRLRALATEPALPPAPAGLSGNVTCANVTIGAVALDSVLVPARAACRLEGTRLVGNIGVGTDATLDGTGIDANGNVQAEGAAHVALAGGSRIGGSVQLVRGGSARIDGLRIGADLQIDAMRGAVHATGNQVGGNLQAIGNRGGLAIENNTMVGNLQCSGNQPAPTVAGNRAASIEDQCIEAPGGGGGGSSGGGTGAPTPAPGNLSGNVTCSGLRIGAVSLDTVIVPAGATCELQGTSLIGSILVGQGARLTALDVRVAGNLQAEGAAVTTLGGVSSIGGSVQVKQGGSASISGATIVGDLQLDAMSGPLSASGNRLGGNLQAVGNRGGVVLNANRMNGAMQCKENVPAPTGSGNVAAIKEDQCRGL